MKTQVGLGQPGEAFDDLLVVVTDYGGMSDNDDLQAALLGVAAHADEFGEFCFVVGRKRTGHVTEGLVRR